MVGGIALLTLNDALMKSLATAYPIGEVLFVRGLFVFFPIAVLAWRAGGGASLRVRNYGGQVARAVLTVASTFLFVTGLSLMPLADAVAVAISGPLFMTALAGPLLGEQVGWRRWGAVILGLAGVLIMLRPGAEAFRWVALFPLASACLGALRDLLTRRLSASESSTSILFFTTLTVTLAGLGTLPLGWRAVAPGDLGLLALSGLLLGGAHFLLIETFRFAEAAVVAPLKFTNMVWAVIFGYLIWGDLPDAWVWSGSALILASGLYIVHRETQIARRGGRGHESA